jgi:signal transduction histidine kinase
VEFASRAPGARLRTFLPITGNWLTTVSAPTRIFYHRLGALIALLVVAVVGCISLAFVSHRHFSRTVNRLAEIELEGGRVSRQFRSNLDDLHGALLRLGTDSAETTVGAVIQQRRQQLNDWIAARQTAAKGDPEREILQRLAAEIRPYFSKLDAILNRSDGLSIPLDRDALVMSDDAVIRLQSLADDYRAVHQQDLLDLLHASLGSLLWMRNLVFGCLVLLVIAVGVVASLLYRDVVRPLREQLVDREALLQKREKLAALGTLAAGVAHEIRNPLTAIKARLYTLRRMLSPAGNEDVTAITKEVDRLERIVRDVLGYARPADPARERVELSAWLREFAVFAEPEVSARGIAFSCTAATTAIARVDANQLRQVMLNLVRNAREALDGRPGRIAVALHREQASLHGRRAAVAVLSVTDDGPGIPLEIQSRLFDPFFTTKAAGTGLGLSIVARLVENLEGEIAFQSAPGSGTRFVVRLPLSEDGQHSTL